MAGHPKTKVEMMTFNSEEEAVNYINNNNIKHAYVANVNGEWKVKKRYESTTRYDRETFSRKAKVKRCVPSYVKEAIKIARELCYSEAVKERLLECRSEDEVSIVMTSARKGMIHSKEGKK